MRITLLKLVTATLLPIALGVACGEEASGDSEAESTWGIECSGDEECGELSCSCGVCTQTCLTNVDCADLGAAVSQKLVCGLDDARATCEHDGPVCMEPKVRAEKDASASPMPDETPMPTAGGAPNVPVIRPPVPHGRDDIDAGVPIVDAGPDAEVMSDASIGDGEPGGGGNVSTDAGLEGMESFDAGLDAGASDGGLIDAGADAGDAGGTLSFGGAGGAWIGAGGSASGAGGAGMGGTPSSAGAGGVPATAGSGGANSGGAGNTGGGVNTGGAAGSAGSAGMGGSVSGGGAGGSAGAGGGAGGTNPCTELGPSGALVTNFDGWDATTAAENWVFSWAGNDAELNHDEGFPQAEFNFVSEGAGDYALRAQAGPTDQNGGAIELLLVQQNACIDASGFTGIRLVVRGESSIGGEFEIGLLTVDPPPAQPDPLMFPLGTDIDEALTLQIPFTDFESAFIASSLVGITIGVNKDDGGQYELIVDAIEFY